MHESSIYWLWNGIDGTVDVGDIGVVKIIKVEGNRGRFVEVYQSDLYACTPKSLEAIYNRFDLSFHYFKHGNP
jgi:hypothetical protein